jgi:uncharacterized protein
MKTLIICTCFLLVTLSASAQMEQTVVDMKKHRIVMQVTTGDSSVQAMVIRQVGNIRAAWPNAQVEVVVQGAGIDLLTTAKSKYAKSVAEWTAKGIQFSACNNTMLHRKMTKAELLPQAVIVPSAIIELTLKQEEGWAYVKGGN